MKIYFCEKCGVSIPLQEVVGGGATARDGKTYCQSCLPGHPSASEDLKLYFCDNCRVSIPLQDVITNRARMEGENMLCVDCGRLSTGERSARREQIQTELKEKEESRYRLHFCDRCHTSIPQSHLVTGRAVVRAGRTYCERCKSRMERKKISVFSGTLVVFFLALLVGGGYVLFRDGGLLARSQPVPVGPSSEEVRMAEFLAEVQSSLAAREKESVDRHTELALRVEELGRQQRHLASGYEEMLETADESIKAEEANRSEMDSRFGHYEASSRLMEGKVMALAALVEELKSRPAAAPEAEPIAAEPVPVRPDEPEPQAEPEASPQVKEWLAELEHDDAGVRFTAAVELGNSGYRPAAGPLAKLLEKDKDTFVRRAAARSLGELDAWSKVPVLIDTLEDKVYFVAIAAHKAIIVITGQDFGFQDNMTRSQLRKVLQKARAWWKEHENDR